MYQKENNSWIKHLDFTLIDVLCTLLAFYLAYYLYVEDNFLAEFYKRLSVVVVLLDIVIALFTEAYTGILRRKWKKELMDTIKHYFIVFLALQVYLYMTKQTFWTSRFMTALFFGFAVAFSFIARTLWKRHVLKRLKESSGSAKLLLMSASDGIAEMIHSFQAEPMLDHVVVGAVSLDKDLSGQTINGVPVVASMDNLYHYLTENVVDEVFLSSPDQDLVERLSEIFLEMGITVHINLLEISSMMPNRVIERCSRYMVLTSSMRIAGPRQLLLKRAMDMIGSFIGLVFTGIAFVIFAPIVKKQSPGPIFYTQKRVGKNGRVFKMYKFRTMCVDADKKLDELKKNNEMQGPMFKMEDDPRIFKIGHFMRKHSIDELPQFWNVLKGDMSLVGTRPPTVEEYEIYDLHHRARLGSKPGITGLWQVSGRNDITDFEQIVRLDTRYINEWTLGLDIRILLRTVKIVFTGKGAK